MSRFKNERFSGISSRKEVATTNSTSSCERIPAKMIKPIALSYEMRLKNLRNISAKLITRVKKSKSFLEMSASKENRLTITAKPGEALTKPLLLPSSMPKSPILPLKSCHLLSAPSLFPSFPKAFSTNLLKLEPKLEAFYK